MKKQNLFKEVKRFFGIGVGVAIEAMSYALFLVPHSIAPGGMTAVALIVSDVTGGTISIGVAYFLLNLPWVAVSWKRMGKKYAIRTIIVSFVAFLFIDGFIALFKDAFHFFDPNAPMANMMIVALFGGLLNGLGIGITFKNRASAGGTDLIAQVLHYSTGLPFGQAILIIDTFIIIGLGFYFQNALYSLYALIALVVSSFVIDIVQEGISYSKSMTIITDQQEKVRDDLLKRLGRGITIIRGEGGFSGKEKAVMIIAVHRSQISKAKNIVLEADPSAFFMIGPLSEVVGEGFKKPKIEEW
jgi:uncharacterized membrane-anchored protein YitT (DUF2179 family)